MVIKKMLLAERIAIYATVRREKSSTWSVELIAWLSDRSCVELCRPAWIGSDRLGQPIQTH
jgi:hypothetical protein